MVDRSVAKMAGPPPPPPPELRPPRSAAIDRVVVIDADEYAEAKANPDPAWVETCAQADTYIEEVERDASS